MGGPISHTCAECGHKMDVPAPYLGTEQKCRKCGAAFLVALPTTKTCPFCAEDIKIEAVVCRFCGRDLVNVDQPPAASVQKPPQSEPQQSKGSKDGPEGESPKGNWLIWAVSSIVVPLFFGFPLIVKYVAGDRLEESAVFSGSLAVLSFLILGGFALSRRPGRQASRAANPNRPSVIVVVGGGFLALCVFLAVVASLFPTDDMQKRKRESRAADVARRAADEKRKQAEDDKIGAWVAAMEFVERRLKAPGSADFPAFHEVAIDSRGGGQFFIYAWVDAQNAFGAMLRTEFACTVRKEGGQWILEDLTMME